MTKREMMALFERNACAQFTDIWNPPSRRKDLCGLILLDRLVPVGSEFVYTMLGAADHDHVWLRIDLDELASRVTEEDVRLLVACGLCIDRELDSLCLHV